MRDEVIESLDRLPTVDEADRWDLADPEAVVLAAKATIALHGDASTLPCLLMRGSLARDLAREPLRTLEAWRTHPQFRYFLYRKLGGCYWLTEVTEQRGNKMDEEQAYNRSRFDGDDGRGFWDILELSEQAWRPPFHTREELDAVEIDRLIDTLRADGWFEQWGLDADVDGLALLHAPRRTLEGWLDSDFAHVMRRA